MRKREALRQAKEAGGPPPWTDDPILARYRFCNVYREYDKVTRWIAQHLRTPLAGSPLLIPVMVAARVINRVDTLEKIRPCLVTEGWTRECQSVLVHWHGRGAVITGAAYMIRTPWGMNKAHGVSQIIASVKPRSAADFPLLRDLHEWLLTHDCLGSFMAGQVVADVKQTPDYAKKPDWWMFAASGPGSRRGMNRVAGPTSEAQWYNALLQLYTEITPLVTRAGLPKMCLQNLQNNLCEFDKYERARLGEGRPKQKYIPVWANDLE